MSQLGFVLLERNKISVGSASGGEHDGSVTKIGFVFGGLSEKVMNGVSFEGASNIPEGNRGVELESGRRGFQERSQGRGERRCLGGRRRGEMKGEPGPEGIAYGFDDLSLDFDIRVIEEAEEEFEVG